MLSTRYYCQIFLKYSNENFHENPSGGSRVVPRGRTDRQGKSKSRVALWISFAGSVVTYTEGQNVLGPLNGDGMMHVNIAI
jgi:hypothetical protein